MGCDLLAATRVLLQATIERLVQAFAILDVVELVDQLSGSDSAGWSAVG